MGGAIRHGARTLPVPLGGKIGASAGWGCSAKDGRQESALKGKHADRGELAEGPGEACTYAEGSKLDFIALSSSSTELAPSSALKRSSMDEPAPVEGARLGSRLRQGCDWRWLGIGSSLRARSGHGGYA